MVGRYIIDVDRSILEDIDTDESSILVAFDKLEGALEDFLWPFKIPPEVHVGTKFSSCIEAAVAPCFGTWTTAY